MKEENNSIPTPVLQSIGGEETFEDYMRNARNEFVKTVTYYFPHESPHDFVGTIPSKEFRVVCENILIAYDQMRVIILAKDKTNEAGEIK